MKAPSYQAFWFEVWLQLKVILRPKSSLYATSKMVNDNPVNFGRFKENTSFNTFIQLNTAAGFSEILNLLSNKTNHLWGRIIYWQNNKNLYESKIENETVQ